MEGAFPFAGKNSRMVKLKISFPLPVSELQQKGQLQPAYCSICKSWIELDPNLVEHLLQRNIPYHLEYISRICPNNRLLSQVASNTSEWIKDGFQDSVTPAAQRLQLGQNSICFQLVPGGTDSSTNLLLFAFALLRMALGSARQFRCDCFEDWGREKEMNIIFIFKCIYVYMI